MQVFTTFCFIIIIKNISNYFIKHLWSNVCRKCGEKEYYCNCKEDEKKLEKIINIHVHVIGYGYLMDVIPFREKYSNCTYRNHLPRRNNSYYTIFYILSKIALWKDVSGIKNSYNFFGYLHPSKFRILTRYQKRITDNCPDCKTPRHIHKIENKKIDHKIYWTTKIQKLKHTRIINFTPDNLTGYYDKKKLTAFKEADIYLMPSRSDAFGIAFLEAWAAGTPVIGARIGATPEVIRENIDGLLVEFDNPLDIAQKVIKLLKNKKLSKKFGLAGQCRVSQNYTWDIVAEKTHDAYQSLLKT